MRSTDRIWSESFGEAPAESTGGQHAVVGVRRIGRVEQAVGVERRDRELRGARRGHRGAGGGRGARRHAADRLRQHRRRAIGVVQRADEVGERRAGGDVQRREAQASAVDAQALEVGVEERHRRRRVAGQPVVDVDAGLAERPRDARDDAVEDASGRRGGGGIGDHAARRRDDGERRDADAHAFEALQRVDRGAGRGVRRGDGDGRGQRTAGADQFDPRLALTSVIERATKSSSGTNSSTPPSTQTSLPTAAIGRRIDVARGDEDAVRRRRIAVAARHLEEEALQAPAE